MPDALDTDALEQALSTLDGWHDDGTAIRRSVELPSFRTAIQVVDQVADVAEELDHHPDIDIRWRTVTFACVTHSAGGVTDRDITLAGRIDEIARNSQ
jgi:4a-hydroxytetrahydrobiopterin dehydratase